MSEEVCIDYQPGQHGWSRFRLTVGTASVVVGPFGYCSDALGDLVRAALMIATSGWRAEVSFDGEPKVWRGASCRMAHIETLADAIAEAEHRGPMTDAPEPENCAERHLLTP